MTSDAIQALGGVGLFLFGMILLTEGLRDLAGTTLRTFLARFTRTPLEGAATGAVSTALVQSSSATTVTTVGFVSAGLLTFPQALGIIFGANVGTTITGWLVAILGFKLTLGDITLPLIFVGAIMRLFGVSRIALLGTALAGFSLVFIGIDVMKAGMAGFEGVVTPASFPKDSMTGRLQLVLIGVLITVVTQSSSAGVATALTALGAGAINLPQAAAMVIGMDVGTTFTAALATVGGSTATRRTGLSHVIYNLLTGFMAFLLLGPFTALASSVAANGDSQIALVAFHSTFNILGVLIILPFVRPFAHLVIKLVPERGPELTRHLGEEMLRDPDAATDAAISTVGEIVNAQFAFLARRLHYSETAREDVTQLHAISTALAETRRFVDAISPGPPDALRSRRILSALHVMDHLGRLYFRCTQEQRLNALDADHTLCRRRNLVRGLAKYAGTDFDAADLEARMNRLRLALRRHREVYRHRIFVRASTGQLEDDEAILRLDALRWLHRVAYHLWRIQHHMNRLHEDSLPASRRREAAVEVLED
ncbi:Na/Pi symporter [Roseobacter sp. YSTF-M11]|uniref:Na/Pi symporter n=1 Tax=Roseobacter insulae TaxID=2859783 RepID=A0A9X1FSB2_9RHOB|nr:Na/Pi symporter [Roseobacter insulae]MBW4706805.1 Na/Pi symporter [Roseobacter insulae]